MKFVVLAFAMAIALPGAAAAQVADRCGQALTLQIPVTAIGLPTGGAVITAAQMVPAEGAVNEHCLVAGKIMPMDPMAPNIEFQVALPATWNGKAVMLGGGGFDGSIPKVAGSLLNMPPASLTPLARGYAVFASDSGHQTAAAEPGAFLLNEEAYRNWMGDALKKTRDAAVAVVTAVYGKAPAKAYFLGGSSGGREGLMAAGRWPEDWDGVVSLFPARNQTIEILGGQGVNRAFAAPGAWPSRAKRQVLYQAALAACDGLDGVKDGLISDVKRCDAVFKPAKAVRCPGGADTGDTCLSDAQLAALEAMNRSVRFTIPLASGETTFPGYNIYTSDSGVSSAAPVERMVSFLAVGEAPPAFPATPEMSLSASFGDNYIRYGIARDPAFNPLSFDPQAPGPLTPRLIEMSTLDVPDKDLTRFAAHGGKLILLHGTADLIVSTRLTEAYVQQLRKTMGEESVASFLRFYEVPGFGHSISTVFYAAWDYLGALENWAENGVDPADTQVVADMAGGPGRTRPLCPYPAWPRYQGKGDVNSAASFRCATR